MSWEEEEEVGRGRRGGGEGGGMPVFSMFLFFSEKNSLSLFLCNSCLSCVSSATFDKGERRNMRENSDRNPISLINGGCSTFCFLNFLLCNLALWHFVLSMHGDMEKAKTSDLEDDSQFILSLFCPCLRGGSSHCSARCTSGPSFLSFSVSRTCWKRNSFHYSTGLREGGLIFPN